ncbi:hypothetical protein BC629DRAFT_690371 [Irpex lacteus]|nr:hypothetical protein BC629DRAFT_690371 [Irpex lacteus]
MRSCTSTRIHRRPSMVLDGPTFPLSAHFVYRRTSPPTPSHPTPPHPSNSRFSLSRTLSLALSPSPALSHLQHFRSPLLSTCNDAQSALSHITFRIYLLNRTTHTHCFLSISYIWSTPAGWIVVVTYTYGRLPYIHSFVRSFHSNLLDSHAHIYNWGYWSFSSLLFFLLSLLLTLTPHPHPQPRITHHGMIYMHTYSYSYLDIGFGNQIHKHIPP